MGGRCGSNRPPATINTDQLDAMQVEAAASVAGHDRLVLVVGPAGAGKTTMLHAAANDLTLHGRPVFGLAPTAEAARVLETETGMPTDTVAKLLYEWSLTDRPPQHPWRLPSGTTVVIDEAGMLGTGDLHRLTRLADQQHWRLTLIGDPHQLQAVGRGGMFTELCATGRTIELDTIHRFHNQWEAGASLKLRHGDPTGLDAYLDHQRVFPAPFAEHCDNIAQEWAGSHERGGYLAITTTTNDHVDAINLAVQDHRDRIGQLGDQRLHLDDVTFCVGDVITTRRNERLLRTTTGDSIRNRDYWTINAVADDGGLAVTRIDGHGHVTLPTEYVAEHVQLGYAATEPGNQSDTATTSITLATPATTCRGLYVAVTRGREENVICVATDTHDVRDAVDVLEQILATDRADLPATRTRRELAATTPAPALKPRCETPDWFTALHHAARVELSDARTNAAAQRQRDVERQQRIDQLTQQLAELEPHCAPHDHAIAHSTNDLHQTQQRQRQAEQQLANSGRLHRRARRHIVDVATDDVTTAHTALNEITRRAQPLLDQRSELRTERDQLQHHLTADQQLSRQLDRYDHRLLLAQHRLDALNTWNEWANGHTPRPAQLINAAHYLHHAGGHHTLLAEPLTTWNQQHGITPTQSTPTPQPALQHDPRREPPGLEIGF